MTAPFFDPIFFPGRRVRLKPGPRPPGVPLTPPGEGMVLRAVQFGDRTVQVEVETGEGDACRSCFFDKDDLDVQPTEEKRLRDDLVGRRIRFPRSSGIGIAFPKGAGDDGIIVSAVFEKGMPKLVVDVETESGMPFTTPCDFTQCDLVPCGKVKK